MYGGLEKIQDSYLFGAYNGIASLKSNIHKVVIFIWQKYSTHVKSRVTTFKPKQSLMSLREFHKFLKINGKNTARMTLNDVIYDLQTLTPVKIVRCLLDAKMSMHE